jgi:exopolyphosphatase/guanosine-5'-triphosphate,3'-diphosphate pyrophosphatase
MDTPQEKARYRLKAVIDAGSTSIRMVIAQIHEDGSFSTLDTLHQSVAVGSDTFTKGRISRETTEACVRVMSSFAAVLKEYSLDLRRDVRAVATSAVREARNRDEFLDRIYMATGLAVEPIGGTEVNRLTFLGIQPLLRKQAALQKGRLLVAEVGGGSTELLGLEEGRVSFAHTYRMGSFRLRETLETLHAAETSQQRMLETEIDAGVRRFCEAVSTSGKKPKLLLLGGEARFAARYLRNKQDEAGVMQVKAAELAELSRAVARMDTEKVAKQYQLNFEEAETLGPALQIYVRLAAVLELTKIHVCSITLREGLLAEAASGNAWSADFVGQILNSVHEIGRRYHLDEAHAERVTENALRLFHALQDEHRLGDHYEVLLTVAARLHDIGMFIGSSSHHKHSKYIIENSDLFGLGEKDIRLVALIARYHRRALPRRSHSEYNALGREDRLVVNKLAAILRVADALDRTHTQALRNPVFKLNAERLLIEVPSAGEYDAEKQALFIKAQMFERVYGKTVVLKTRRKQE